MASRLESILNSKTRLIEREQAQLEKLIVRLGQQFANDFGRIVGEGIFTPQTIADALEELGYSRGVINSLSKFENVLGLNRQLASAVGIDFLLTPQNESLLLDFIENTAGRITETFRAEIASDLYQFGLQSKLSQRPITQIINEARERLEVSGRRVSTEVATALSTFDRSSMNMLYEQAGVKKFFYHPPTLIPTSRKSCIDAVSSPLQQTGWTRADIDANPDIDIVLGGKPYYNCRHEFIPFDSAKTYGLI